MDDKAGPPDGRARIDWICCGLLLLAASPFIPATTIGLWAAAVAGLGLMVWSHASNPPIPLPVYVFQVLIWNIPLVGWWGLLATEIPAEQWRAPAIAAASAAYSFSLGAVGLFIWFIEQPRWARLTLVAAAVVLFGAAITTIWLAAAGRSDAPTIIAAVTTTFALLLQRLLALPFSDYFLRLREGVMGVVGIGILAGVLGGLLPHSAKPALVYGGAWLLIGAFFTLLGGAGLQIRSKA